MEEKMALIAFLNKYARLEGETLQQFAQEIKKLTDRDRQDFKKMIALLGENSSFEFKE